ncbi:MAG TPA: aryl-alcohol dehydrogenase [Bacteroidetes bacterium]|nr:aryl-alcohol dehydrogenase [Bacteroidota bacterium]
MSNLSKIVLGTAQFGIDYGISNRIGKTHSLEVEKILQYASKQGINILDTASSYGNAENLISDYIANKDKNSWNVITKIPHFKGNIIDSKQVDKLSENVEFFQKKIGKESIYGLLIHNYDDLFLPGADNLMNTLERLKKEGVVKKIGVSVYTGEQIDHILNNYSIDIIQLPFNILDQRLMKGGYLTKLKEFGIEVHARSIFLQGLLLMPLNNMHSWFNPILGALEDFHLEAKKMNLTALQLALAFVQSSDDIDRLVVGVNTLEQLREIVNAKSVRINTTEFYNLSVDNAIFLNPSNWKV